MPLGLESFNSFSKPKKKIKILEEWKRDKKYHKKEKQTLVYLEGQKIYFNLKIKSLMSMY